MTPPPTPTSLSHKEPNLTPSQIAAAQDERIRKLTNDIVDFARFTGGSVIAKDYKRAEEIARKHAELVGEALPMIDGRKPIILPYKNQFCIRDEGWESFLFRDRCWHVMVCGKPDTWPTRESALAFLHHHTDQPSGKQT